MAEDREKLVQQQTQKMAEERNKIETFADFGNMYNFKKRFYLFLQDRRRPDAGHCPRNFSQKERTPVDA